MIGTENESSLHRDLKYRYAGPQGETEAEVGGFVADAVNDQGEYIEVQTGSFAPLKKKALALCKLGKGAVLRVIHPVIITKYIEVYNKKGRLQYRRKSPRRGSAWDVFDVLVYSPRGGSWRLRRRRGKRSGRIHRSPNRQFCPLKEKSPCFPRQA